MKHIYDKDFVYRGSANTDIKKTFARIRREIEQSKKTEKSKVTSIKNRAAK